MRRALIILAAVIVLAGLAAAAYFFIFAKSPGLTAATNTNPFGNGAGNATNTGNNGTDTTGASTNQGTVAVTERLVKVAVGPVVPGEVVFTSSSTAPVVAQTVAAGTSTASTTVSIPLPDTEIRYAERRSGNLFSYLFHSHVSTRIVNKTIPGVQEASWLPNGSIAYLRYAGGSAASPEIDTYGLPADGSAGFLLPLNLAQALVTGSSSLFTLATGANGSIGSVSKSDGSASHTVFSSPLANITIAAAGKGQFVAYTKPTALAAGYAYLIDSAGGFTRILGPLTGLSVLPSPSGNWALFSYVDQGALKTQLYNVKTRVTLPLPIATLSEKCVWAPDESAVYCGVPIAGTVPSGTYPDDWYQGAVSFTDQIWKIDVGGRFAQLTLDFSSTAKSPLDATALAIDPKKDVLVFLNKRDGSLWAYDL